MKHWDLMPGEDVTLVSDSGIMLYGYFQFRDTIRAGIMIEDADGNLKYKEFRLVDDGGLRSGHTDHRGNFHGRHRWTIKGQDRETRHVYDSKGLMRVQQRETLTRRAFAGGKEA